MLDEIELTKRLHQIEQQATPSSLHYDDAILEQQVFRFQVIADDTCGMCGLKAVQYPDAMLDGMVFGQRLMLP